MLRKIKGFTLLELIVVIVILGILAALAIPTFAKVIERSNISVATTELQAVAREANAIAAFDGEGSTKYTLNQFLETGVSSSAYSSGTYAAGSSLKSVAWLEPGKETVYETKEEVILSGNTLDQVSRVNGYFSLSYSDENNGAIGLAMRTGDGANCVFVAYENGAFKGTESKTYTPTGVDACRGTVALKNLTDVETGTGGGNTSPEGSVAPGTQNGGNTPGALTPGGSTPVTPGEGNNGGVEGLDFNTTINYVEAQPADPLPTIERLTVTFNELPEGTVQDSDHVKLTCTTSSWSHPGFSELSYVDGKLAATWDWYQIVGEEGWVIPADFAPHTYSCNLVLTDASNGVLADTNFEVSTNGHAAYNFTPNYNTGQLLALNTFFNEGEDYLFSPQVSRMTSTCEAVDFEAAVPNSVSQVGKTYTEEWSSTGGNYPTWSVNMNIDGSGAAGEAAGNIFTCETHAYDGKGTLVGIAHDENIKIELLG